MNKVIDKGFRSCRFVSTIVKHPVYANFQLEHFIIETIGFTENFVKVIVITSNFQQRIFKRNIVTFKGFAGISPA